MQVLMSNTFSGRKFAWENKDTGKKSLDFSKPWKEMGVVRLK